ncbi:hypothetical protein ACMFMG_007930 [Clarireedia jacksonii]
MQVGIYKFRSWLSLLSLHCPYYHGRKSYSMLFPPRFLTMAWLVMKGSTPNDARKSARNTMQLPHTVTAVLHEASLLLLQKYPRLWVVAEETTGQLSQITSRRKHPVTFPNVDDGSSKNAESLDDKPRVAEMLATVESRLNSLSSRISFSKKSEY